MAFWACARFQPQKELFALQCLRIAGFVVYSPQLRVRRVLHGRKIETCAALFPGYAFVLIDLQWHAARWAPGTNGLIMDGTRPARVADAVIDEIRSRERGGLIDVPNASRLAPGTRVRVLAGPFRDHLAIYAGMTGRERVVVLLRLLGGERRIEIAKDNVERADCG